MDTSGLGVAALIPVASAADLEREAERAQQAQQQRPVIQGLAAHVRRRWEVLRDYKNREITPRLNECLRARSMKYDPEKLAQIKSQGGSEIYMGIAAAKCRTATAWLRDALLGSGADKPWSIEPTPVPDLPPEVVERLQLVMQQTLMAHYAQGGEPLGQLELQQLAGEMQDTARRSMEYEAELRVERMETKMEDQLVEGGFSKAIHEFTDDIATFPFAVLKGPAPRKRKTMKWANGGLATVEETRDEYERVDPYKIYWAPWGDNLNDIPVIELHELTREDLQGMLGVEGYNDAAIRSILDNFGTYHDWLDGSIDNGDDITGKRSEDGIDDVVYAVQLWDSVIGKDLLEWGLDAKVISDKHLSYPCEVWMVGNVVFKAVLNYDPLARKPYFSTSYEKIPGRIDGNGVADLCLDAQAMCNAAARALSNNMGIASGPQVGVNISRLPPGENITQMFPWKIWQFKASEYGDNSPPMEFFQPQSNAPELMQVFDRYLAIADEMTGIPRYMTGEHVPGAGRTSSGLSMLISNAGKSIKQVINNIDKDVIEPLLQRKYQRNLRYSQDPDLIGDVQIVARGAMALVVKEAEAVRRQEFLNIVLQSPLASEIVGKPGAAELLRDMAKHLNMNVDRVVPTREQVEEQVAQEQQMQQMLLMMQMQPEQEDIQFQRDEKGAVTGAKKTKPKQIQADGSQKGGTESNYVSSRPRGN